MRPVTVAWHRKQHWGWNLQPPRRSILDWLPLYSQLLLGQAFPLIAFTIITIVVIVALQLRHYRPGPVSLCRRKLHVRYGAGESWFGNRLMEKTRTMTREQKVRQERRESHFFAKKEEWGLVTGMDGGWSLLCSDLEEGSAANFVPPSGYLLLPLDTRARAEYQTRNRKRELLAVLMIYRPGLQCTLQSLGSLVRSETTWGWNNE